LVLDSRPLCLDIIVPVYNEESTLPELFAQLEGVLDGIENLDWRVILVDDGSRDASADIILARADADPRYGLVSLSRNFGQQAAISAGLDHTDADVVVVMDCDLQDPPQLIPDMIAKWREGFEVVYAIRRSRRESSFKRAGYRIFYRLMQRISKTPIPLDSGDFCLMSRRVVQHLQRLPERNRFIRGLRAWIGFRQTGVEYDRPARVAGASKYSYRRLMRLAMSGFIGFSNLPLQVATWLGFMASALAMALFAWVLITTFSGVEAPTGWASTIAVVLLMSGVQLMILGVIGEYLGNVNDEVRGRPTYLVDRCLNAGPRPLTSQQTAAPQPKVEVTVMPIARSRPPSTPASMR